MDSNWFNNNWLSNKTYLDVVRRGECSTISSCWTSFLCLKTLDWSKNNQHLCTRNVWRNFNSKCKMIIEISYMQPHQLCTYNFWKPIFSVYWRDNASMIGACLVSFLFRSLTILLTWLWNFEFLDFVFLIFCEHVWNLNH